VTGRPISPSITVRRSRPNRKTAAAADLALDSLRGRETHYAGTLPEAIQFGHAKPVAERVRLAYRLSIDEFRGQRRLRMLVGAAG